MGYLHDLSRRVRVLQKHPGNASRQVAKPANTPYVCRVCRRAFRNPAALKLHYAENHE